MRNTVNIDRLNYRKKTLCLLLTCYFFYFARDVNYQKLIVCRNSKNDRILGKHFWNQNCTSWNFAYEKFNLNFFLTVEISKKEGLCNITLFFTVHLHRSYGGRGKTQNCKHFWGRIDISKQKVCRSFLDMLIYISIHLSVKFLWKKY